VSHVVNFELPEVPESSVHRIGRTARAGNEGAAFSLCDHTERHLLRAIEKLTRQQIPAEDRRSPGSPALDAPRQGQRAGKPGGRSGYGKPRSSFEGRPRRDFEGKPRGEFGDKPRNGFSDKPRNGFEGKPRGEHQGRSRGDFEGKPHRGERPGQRQGERHAAGRPEGGAPYAGRDGKPARQRDGKPGFGPRPGNRPQGQRNRPQGEARAPR